MGKGWGGSKAMQGGSHLFDFVPCMRDKATYLSCANSFCLHMRFVVVTDV